MSNCLDRTDPDTLCKCRASWDYRCGACMCHALHRDCDGEEQQYYGLQAILDALKATGLRHIRIVLYPDGSGHVEYGTFDEWLFRFGPGANHVAEIRAAIARR